LAGSYNNEPLLEMFVFETTQLLEQLEQIIIANCYEQENINEIFRIMHTIKGSSAMMNFKNISMLTHKIEDLFYFIRDNKPPNIDYSKLSDIMLESIDFIKLEISKIENGNKLDGDSSPIREKVDNFLTIIKDFNYKAEAAEEKTENSAEKAEEDSKIQNDVLSNKKKFKATVFFEEDCELENIRAYTLINDLKTIAEDIYYIPDIEKSDRAEIIRKDGIQIWFKTDISFNDVHSILSKTIFLRNMELIELEESNESNQHINSNIKQFHTDVASSMKDMEQNTHMLSSNQSMISVNVAKLDKLMDLVGELVISETMVTHNSDLEGLKLDNFQKAASQHRKIINELQDIAMSIRMVPLSATFRIMNRIVHDMSKKLSKEVRLEIIGEETEVDKNIIECISDPLMHIVRNSIDHGIEPTEERKAKGKPDVGTIILEAKNVGGDVLIIIKDDGRGLDKRKILDRAKARGLMNRPESELTDKEIYSYIFLPGFSTNENVTEYSGRGVGMDVVAKNIGSIGGTVSVDSIPDKGATITLKIPLTLAIMDGMIVRIGNVSYTIPTLNIKESFKPKENDVIRDPDGNEIIMIRGECYPVLRLNELYKIKTDITSISDGIIVMVESEGKYLCIFVDALVGERQVVVKVLPKYIRNFKKIRGIAGCTLLGDGSISLILDIADLITE